MMYETDFTCVEGSKIAARYRKTRIVHFWPRVVFFDHTAQPSAQKTQTNTRVLSLPISRSTHCVPVRTHSGLDWLAGGKIKLVDGQIE